VTRTKPSRKTFTDKNIPITVWFSTEQHAAIVRHVNGIRVADPNTNASVSGTIRELALGAIDDHVVATPTTSPSALSSPAMPKSCLARALATSAVVSTTKAEKGNGAVVGGADPCMCGHSPEEHGHDDKHTWSTACGADGDNPGDPSDGCDCIAYEADSSEV
jgi:hypothetical protein